MQTPGVPAPQPGDGDIVHTGSISSAVELDLVHGEAHKVYHPKLYVRVLYWLAFQSPFPYVHNHYALEAARLRRIIVDLLTKVWFGHHLVARVVDVADTPEGGHDFVTRLVKGKEPDDLDRAKVFLKKLDRHFLESGLPTWQTTPYNPHAITNFIEEEDGTYRLIDLESSLVALLYPLSRVIGLIRLGQFPSFDDIDTPRLNAYIEAHAAEIDAALPAGERDLLDRTVVKYAAEQALWHKSERRYLPRVLRFLLRLVDVPSWVRGVARLTERAGDSAETFVREGIDEWQSEGRITATDAAEAKERLAAPPVAYAMLHLGAHFAISVPLRFPLGASARFIYTVVLRLNAEVRALGRRASASDARKTHTVAVAAFALMPGFGRLAYLLAEPIRSNRLLIIVPMDVAAKHLPARAYERLHIAALTDWWARPADAGRRSWSARLSSVLRNALDGALRLRVHLVVLAGVIAVNAAVVALVAADALDGASFGSHDLVRTSGALQYAVAAVAGVAAFGAFWRRPSGDAAEAAGMFLWPIIAIGLAIFAADNYFEVRYEVGDWLADRFTGGANFLNDAALLGYASAGAAMLYLFRQELLAPRASAVLLVLASMASGITIAAELADDLELPIHAEFSNHATAAGFWLAAAAVRLQEVMRGRSGRAVRREKPQRNAVRPDHRQ